MDGKAAGRGRAPPPPAVLIPHQLYTDKVGTLNPEP